MFPVDIPLDQIWVWSLVDSSNASKWHRQRHLILLLDMFDWLHKHLQWDSYLHAFTIQHLLWPSLARHLQYDMIYTHKKKTLFAEGNNGQWTSLTPLHVKFEGLGLAGVVWFCSIPSTSNTMSVIRSLNKLINRLSYMFGCISWRPTLKYIKVINVN